MALKGIPLKLETEETNQSPETETEPKSSSNPSSLEPSLPSVSKRRGRPPGSKNRTIPLPTPSDVTDVALGEVNKLPSDPKELASVIEPYKVMARPCVDLINGLAKVTKTQELDKEERESGNTAFAAMFYQMGGQLDARVLITLWLVSVVLPRAIEYMERMSKEREAKKGPVTVAA